MKRLIAKLLLASAALALSACSSLPDWMPGSGAIEVNLSGAEEVPPLNVPGSGGGSFRVADDGTITGSVTTRDVQGTMAHITAAPRARTGRSSCRSTRMATPTPFPPAQAHAGAARRSEEGNLYVTCAQQGRRGAGQLQP